MTDKKSKKGKILLLSFTVFFVFSIILSAIFYSHIILLYYLWTNKIDNDFVINNTPIDNIELPKDWKPVKENFLTFYLPNPETFERKDYLASNPNGEQIVVHFRLNKFFVSIDCSKNTLPFYDNTDGSIIFFPAGRTFTFPEIKLETNKVTTKNFSFLLSRKEIIELGFLLTQKDQFFTNDDESTESFFWNDIIGCISYYKHQKMANLFWQLNGTTIGGNVNFISADKPIDKDFVRAFCRGLKVNK